MNFDDEFKWCPDCKKYVNYLQSYNFSFCTECGGKVHLFSKQDWDSFQKRLKKADHQGSSSRRS